MTSLKNKRAATVIALAIILILAVAFFLLFGSKEHEQHEPASGDVVTSYPLVSQPNCREPSGECDLESLAFSAKLTLSTDGRVLRLSSAHSLQGVSIIFIESEGGENTPLEMRALGAANTRWELELPFEAPIEASNNSLRDTTIKALFLANGVSYFAETTMQFADVLGSPEKNLQNQ